MTLNPEPKVPEAWTPQKSQKGGLPIRAGWAPRPNYIKYDLINDLSPASPASIFIEKTRVKTLNGNPPAAAIFT